MKINPTTAIELLTKLEHLSDKYGEEVVKELREKFWSLEAEEDIPRFRKKYEILLCQLNN